MLDSVGGRSPWAIFFLVAVAQFMVVLDVAITNVALPAIRESLGFTTESSLQWVITAYALTFGGFLLLGGRAADLYGRRRVLLVGMLAFTFISLLIGFASTATMLIALRAVQGIAAALMSPAALSIILTSFPEGNERNRALAYWSIVATGGASVGLLLGGVLTQFLGWQWNFFVNVPVGLVVAFLILRIVPKHEQEESDTTLDLPGAVLATFGLMLFVFGMSEATGWGWLSGATIGTVVLSLLVLAGFIWNESRAAHPLMPLSVFRIRNVTGANLMMTPMVACMLGMFFLLSLYVQTVLQYEPLVAGLAFLPFPLILAIVSSQVPRLVERYGYRRFLIMGPVIVGAALLWLMRIPVDGSYLVDLLPAFIVMPVGIGMTFMPVIAAATAGVPAHEAGLASGLVNTSQQMGGALGLSILSGVATYFTQAHAGGAMSPEALVYGFSWGFTGAFVFILLSLACALFIIREEVSEGNEHFHETVHF